MVLTKMVKRFGFIGTGDLLFSSKIDSAISIILTKNLCIKKSESLIIIYDSKKEDIARRFFEVSSTLLDNVEWLKIPVAKVNGQEPPRNAEEALSSHDVAIILTQKSISHTKARRDASEKGTRIASMPGITEPILKRSIDIDYSALKKDILRIGKLLDRAKTASIKTKYGTDIIFSIEGRKAHGLSAGIYNKKGKWGNLPEGEVYIAPVEGTANGHFVVDGSIAGFGKMHHPLILFVKDGYISKITDGKKPAELQSLLNKYGKDARNIAEFGIGLNKKAKVTGVVLEDEKAYGTCHLALGNNIGFGGKVDVPFHMDCVMKKPDICLDNKCIIRKGKLLI
jgi:aminopeptidase